VASPDITERLLARSTASSSTEVRERVCLLLVFFFVVVAHAVVGSVDKSKGPKGESAPPPGEEEGEGDVVIIHDAGVEGECWREASSSLAFSSLFSEESSVLIFFLTCVE